MTTIFVITTVFFILSTIVLSAIVVRTNKKLADVSNRLNKVDDLRRAQTDLEKILNTGIAAFLHVSIKKSLDRLEEVQKDLNDAEKLNVQLTQWVEDFGKLTGDVYKQLKTIDERGIFEKDDDVGFLFQDILDIISQYNTRVNTIQNDDRNNIADENKK